MNDKMSDKLLPCPFCGGEHIGETIFNWNYAIMCRDCGAVMTVPMNFEGNREDELVRKWNTRKPMEKIVERLEFQAEKNRDYWNNFGNECAFGAMDAYTNAIEIVKEEIEI